MNKVYLSSSLLSALPIVSNTPYAPLMLCFTAQLQPLLLYLLLAWELSQCVPPLVLGVNWVVCTSITAHYPGLYSLPPYAYRGTILTKLICSWSLRTTPSTTGCCSCFSGCQSSSNGHLKKVWILTAQHIPHQVSVSHSKDLLDCSCRF